MITAIITKAGTVLLIFVLNFVQTLWGQDTHVVLKEGTIMGTKVFPETSKVPVYAYLGIPYAAPPIKNLRFARPVPVKTWNRTLFTRDFKPICPQLQPNTYEEANEGFRANGEFHRTSEDCLFVNVWSPESAFRYGSFPVLVIITGEEMAFDWIINRPSGLDLASEGLVVITVQYRTNILGWFGLETPDAPMNVGLWDQQLALKWIQNNVQKFGGDPNKVVILGHGTSGATCAMIHLISPRSKDLFSKMIIMSGTLFSPYSFQDTDRGGGAELMEKIVKNLACNSQNAKLTLQCMRDKSLSDLMKAFENVYKNGNYTKLLGPIVDDFLTDETLQFITEDPRKLLRLNTFKKVPILIGITNNEGAFLKNHWVDLSKQGYKMLKKFIDSTVTSNILEMMGFNEFGMRQARETVNWKFFDQIPKTNVHLLNALQRIVSETKYELPFYETIEILSSEGRMEKTSNVGNSSRDEFFNVSSISSTKRTKLAKRKVDDDVIYAYSFQQSNSIDMRGKVNYFGGASHSSDLPFLMGPSLFQQIARRRLSPQEEKFCRKIRQMFSDFIKSGNPTPGRLFDAWQPYTQTTKYIKIISASNAAEASQERSQSNEFEENLEKIDQLLKVSDPLLNSGNDRLHNPYAITNNEEGANTRNKKVLDYASEHKNNEYYQYLTKIYSFWRILLPKIYRNLNEKNRNDNESRDQTEHFGESSLDGAVPQYKHAFFSMLTLVCLLLAILCICLYILKKNKNVNANFL